MREPGRQARLRSWRVCYPTGLKRTTLACAILVVAALSVVGCAAQIRPTSTAPFEGRWRGVWTNTEGASGGVEVDIIRQSADRVFMSGNVTWVGGGIGVNRTLELRDGELSSTNTVPTFDQNLRLYGENRLQGEYHWKTTGSRGVWSLTRSAPK